MKRRDAKHRTMKHSGYLGGEVVLILGQYYAIQKGLCGYCRALTCQPKAVMLACTSRSPGYMLVNLMHSHKNWDIENMNPDNNIIYLIQLEFH